MRRSVRLALAFCTCALGAAAGCTSALVPGAGAGTGHNLLLESAQEIRDANPPPPLPRELAKTPLMPYTVEPGDVVLVTATEEPNAKVPDPALTDTAVRLPGDQTVMQDGTIDLGRYGRIMVIGRTVDQMEAEIGEAIAAVHKTVGRVNVRVVTRVSKVYYVLGEVNAPGPFPLAGRETALDGIIAAGGLNSNAAQDQIIISRPSLPDGCRTVLPVCYRQIVQLGDTTTNYQLMPGDRIFVASRGFLDILCPRRSVCKCADHAQVGCKFGGCAPTGGVAAGP